MPDVMLTKQEIESEKVEQLREWMTDVPDREDEALETLEHEGMLTESAFIEHTDDGDYLVYYMEAEDIEEVFAAYEDSPYEIDKEHKELLTEVLVDGENVGDYELLYHLTRARS